jgi:hypothetical protein
MALALASIDFRIPATAPLLSFKYNNIIFLMVLMLFCCYQSENGVLFLFF